MFSKNFPQTATNQTKINELKIIPCSIRESFGIKNVLQITAMIQE